MKELLADNVALLRRIQVNAGINHQAITNTSKLREIADPLTWTYCTCMLSFLAVKVPHPETRQIVAYICAIFHLLLVSEI